jgi:hypothetical protein
LEQTRCHAGASVPQQIFCGFGPKTMTSDLWNKTRTRFAGTGSTQNPVGKKGFIPDFESSGHIPVTVSPLQSTHQHNAIFIVVVVVVVPFCQLLLLL